MRLFLLLILVFCSINLQLFAQNVHQLPLFAQAETIESDELEISEQEPLDDETESLDSLPEDQTEAPSNIYLDVDIGVPITFFPHRSLWNAYKDSDWHYGLRAATSLTIDRFRFEYGYLQAKYDSGEPNINYYEDKDITNSSSSMTLDQREILFFWLRNDPHRISFIGGGYVYLTVDEEFSMDYFSENQTHTITRKESDEVRGIKFVVGGKDTDSLLKTTFSYTSVFVETKTGKRYDLGGFAFTFSLSFSGM